MNWESIPLYGIAKPKQIVNCVDRELLSVYLGKGVVPFSSQTAKRTNVTSTDLSKYQAVDYGDFVLNNQQAWRGSVGVSKYSGIVSPAYIVLSLSDEIETNYANYLFQSRMMIDQYVLCSKGVGSIQRNIYWNYLKRVSLPLPPREEQDQIVRYLDWQVSKTNKLIHAFKDQIALLKEQRQAFISEAVTKGGESWQQKRIINLVQHIKAGAWGEEAGGYGVDFDCIRVADFDFERLTLSKTTYTVRNYQQRVIDNLSLQKGDILVEKSGGGDKQTVGRAVMYSGDSPVLYANFIEAIRSNSDVDSTYLTYLLASQYYLGRNRLHFNQTTGIQNLHVKGYLRESVFVPPLIEQQAIAKQLNAQCETINELIQKIKTIISLLNEYRTRLISDVVTGQIDVRDVDVPNFEYITDEDDNASDDESIDIEETVDEEE